MESRATQSGPDPSRANHGSPRSMAVRTSPRSRSWAIFPASPLSLDPVARSRLLRARDHRVRPWPPCHDETGPSPSGPVSRSSCPRASRTSTATTTRLHVYNCLFRAELIDAELMWARRDPVLGPLFDPDSLDARGRHRGHGRGRRWTLRTFDEFIEALEPIRTGEATSRAAQLAHLLLALDIVARSNGGDRPANGDLPSASSSLVHRRDRAA